MKNPYKPSDEQVYRTPPPEGWLGNNLELYEAEPVEKPKRKRWLYKTKENRLLFGVCAGISDQFDFDPTILRVTVGILSIAVFPFPILLYLFLAAILPKKTDL